MKTYTYTARNMDGKIIKSSIQCEDYDEFLVKIQDKGLFCITHKEIDPKNAKALHKFTTKELAFNCRQLSAMMSSGLTLVKSLSILANEQEKDVSKLIFQDVYEDVQKGRSFSEALTSQKGCFPEFLLSMIRAGESSGSLDSVMNRMQDHYAKESRLNNKIRGALTYPIILCILCVAVVVLMGAVILPQFMGILGDADLPPLTQALFGIVEFIKTKWYLFVGIILVIVIGFRYGLTQHDFRVKFDRFKIKGPGFGKLMVKVYTGRFSRTLANLYSSGIPMIECLERSSKILNNTYIDELFEVVVDEVKQGESLSKAIERTGIFDSMFCSIILVGEESGALDDILTKSSEYYEDESDSAIQKLVTMVEPIMIIFMGVCVGFVLAAIFPALFSMYDAVV